ncbi:hypothetical protein PPACK8108_LOCUS9053 [Phakopsora pachyrhizi]|uniref:Uncharacterized protein n=1 Tax=Phakopsora pachyrhizi TaxID=170000 RepID=A0AAV0AXQ8_PHAPC|nr:hypothetical protein PPACK8108_LOCUS9053 [Phakopsora pachyrhizi]
MTFISSVKKTPLRFILITRVLSTLLFQTTNFNLMDHSTRPLTNIQFSLHNIHSAQNPYINNSAVGFALGYLSISSGPSGIKVLNPVNRNSLALPRIRSLRSLAPVLPLNMVLQIDWAQKDSPTSSMRTDDYISSEYKPPMPAMTRMKTMGAGAGRSSLDSQNFLITPFKEHKSKS